jgi:hypothetical protein
MVGKWSIKAICGTPYKHCYVISKSVVLMCFKIKNLARLILE